MTKKTTKRLVGLIGIVISIAFLWFLFKQFDFKQALNSIKKVDLWHFFLMIIVYLSTFYFRAVRWQAMLLDKKTKFSTSVNSLFVGFAGNNVIPARGGELLRMEYFSRNSTVKRASSLTFILLEKILDAIVLLGVLFLAITFTHIDEDYFYIDKLGKLLGIIFIPLIIGLIIFKTKGKAIINWLNLKLPKPLLKVTALLEDIHEALNFLKPNLNSMKILATSILIWTLEALVFYMGFYSIGLNGSLVVMALLSLGVVNFSILIPSSPGYLGVFQAAVVAALLIFGINENQALAASIIIHSAQYIPVTIIGAIILFKSFFNQARSS